MSYAPQICNDPFLRGPDGDAGFDLAAALADFFTVATDTDKDFLPDLDLVPMEGLAAGPVPIGFLVCHAGPGEGPVRAGDIITEVDGLRVALLPAERDELLHAAAALADEDEEGLTLEALSATAVGREVERRRKGAVRGLFQQLDPEGSGRAGVEACCSALAGELARALFGPYKSPAKLSLWRKGGGSGSGGEFEAVSGPAECLRTRDARRRGQPPTPTPERCCGARQSSIDARVFLHMAANGHMDAYSFSLIGRFSCLFWDQARSGALDHGLMQI